LALVDHWAFKSLEGEAELAPVADEKRERCGQSATGAYPVHSDPRVRGEGVI
jgi:hypothetical protein